MTENEIKLVLRDPTRLEALLAEIEDMFATGSRTEPIIIRMDIIQAYLNQNNRLRRITERNGKQQFYLTYKQRLDNHYNLEIEGTIDQDVFDHSWDFTNRRLTKRRFEIAQDDQIWDIDFYRWEHPYFALAEVELPEGVDEFETLSLIADHVHFVVPRDDGRFSGYQLADEDHARQMALELGLL